MVFTVHANLDCEARWAGIALPQAVERRISLYGALLAALAPVGEPVEVWTPAAVDATRVIAAPGFVPPALRVGVPPRPALAWADPGARAANDRRLALALATAHGCALPGARVIDTVDDIDLAGPWVCKAPWTAAGRDRCHGAGAPTAEQRTRVGRLLRLFGSLVLEPWCDRLVDAGVCATVAAGGAVTAHPPHGLLVDGRGRFLGIDLAPPPLADAEHAQLAAMVAAAGARLATLGHVGPFTVDAFAYRAADGTRRFQPLCEINARYSFGWIARACAARSGHQRLGFGPAPTGATVLIAPGADGVTAWLG